MSALPKEAMSTSLSESAVLKPLKVLHIMASGAQGGGANHLKGLLPALKDLGLSCLAVVGSDGPLVKELLAAGITVSTSNLFISRLDLTAPWRLAYMILVAKPDIVHFHGTRAAFFGAVVCFFNKCFTKIWRRSRPWKSVYTAHGVSYHQRLRGCLGKLQRSLSYLAEYLICKAVDLVISVSAADLEEFIQQGFIKQGLYLPNALPAVYFERPADREARAQARLFKELGLEVAESQARAPVLIGTVARLVPQKAVGDLIQAVARCPERVHLVIIGEGPERLALTALAEALLPKRVHFLGARDDVAQLLPAFTLFALSSHWEGEPIALLEALASGLPVVATKTPGAVEILAQTTLKPLSAELAAKFTGDVRLAGMLGAGLLVEIGDVEDLAAKLRGLLAALQEEPALRAYMAAGGRLSVQDRQYALQARKLVAAYRELFKHEVKSGR